jgi:preprotein translocase subunit SecA
MRMAEKSLLLQLLDQAWKDHLLTLDQLRQGINLRAYAQRDPLNEYKREAFELFEELLSNLRESVTAMLSHLELRIQRPEDAMMPGQSFGELRESRTDPAFADGGDPPDPHGAAPRRVGAGGVAVMDPADPSTWTRTPRNSLCPCGSGKKYKHCHGRV